MLGMESTSYYFIVLRKGEISKITSKPYDKQNDVAKLGQFVVCVIVNYF